MSTSHKNNLYQRRWYTSNGNPNGTIFKIVNKITGDFYIGSTTIPLKKRLWQAYAAAGTGQKGPLYQSIREHGKENFEILLIYECKEGDNCKALTRRALRNLEPALNRKS